MIHAKKILPEFFEPLRSGSKTFELRREEEGDPQYAVGDFLALNEFDPEKKRYTGRALVYKIRYRLEAEQSCGTLSPGCVALGLGPVYFDSPK